MALTAVQLYQLALSAGFPPPVAAQMVAIALKESGGNPLAHNTLPPDDSYGLFQINMYGNLGPARMVQFGLSSPSDLFDPTTNAAAAYQLWGGSDNNLNVAWAIYGADASRYQQYLPAALQAQADYNAATGAGGIMTGGGGMTVTGSPPLDFHSGLSAPPASSPSFSLPGRPPGGPLYRQLPKLVSRFWAALHFWKS